MNDLDFIKNFSKITVINACRISKVDISNLYAGRVKKEKVKKIRKILESDIEKLYPKENLDDNKKESLL